jgi:hypothetical protein
LQAKQQVGIWNEWTWIQDPDWVQAAADESPMEGCTADDPEAGAGQGHTGTDRDICPGCPPSGGTGRDTGLEACPAVPLGQDPFEHWGPDDEYERMH